MKRSHRAAHRLIWLLLACLLPAILLVALLARPVGPIEAQQTRLAGPK